MSKKTISFHIPQNNPDQALLPAPLNMPALGETSADQWVHRQEIPAGTVLAHPANTAHEQRAIGPSVTISVSDAPNWFEALKIGFLLPHLTVWLWTLNVAQRSCGYLALRHSTNRPAAR